MVELFLIEKVKITHIVLTGLIIAYLFNEILGGH